MKPIKKYDVQEDDDNSFVKTSGMQQQPHDFEKKQSFLSIKIREMMFFKASDLFLLSTTPNAKVIDNKRPICSLRPPKVPKQEKWPFY